MRGTTRLKVIERPASFDIAGGKNSAIYAEIIATLDIMKATQCIEIAPDEIAGKNLKTKCVNLRAGLNRIIKLLGKEYKPAVSYNTEKDIIWVWSRIKFK